MENRIGLDSDDRLIQTNQGLAVLEAKRAKSEIPQKSNYYNTS